MSFGGVFGLTDPRDIIRVAFSRIERVRAHFAQAKVELIDADRRIIYLHVNVEGRLGDLERRLEV